MNQRGQKISNDTHRSKTDPDARISRKSFKATTDLYYSATYLMDNKSRIIVGTDIGESDKKTDRDNAIKQMRRIKWKYKLKPESLGADKGYAAGEFIHNVINEDIQPHIPIFEYQRHNHKGIYERERFKYDEMRDIFICPEGKELKYWGIHKHSRQHVYRASKKDCEICSKKHECTKDRARSVGYHIYEDSINRAKQLNETMAYIYSELQFNSVCCPLNHYIDVLSIYRYCVINEMLQRYSKTIYVFFHDKICCPEKKYVFFQYVRIG